MPGAGGTTAVHQSPPWQGIPNPTPAAPPGFQAIERVLSYIKWVAAASVAGLFFLGICVSGAGRLWDHRGSGVLGGRMMVGSVGLAIAFGFGYVIITSFASTS